MLCPLFLLVQMMAIALKVDRTSANENNRNHVSASGTK